MNKTKLVTTIIALVGAASSTHAFPNNDEIGPPIGLRVVANCGIPNNNWSEDCTLAYFGVCHFQGQHYVNQYGQSSDTINGHISDTRMVGTWTEENFNWLMGDIRRCNGDNFWTPATQFELIITADPNGGATVSGYAVLY